jgi:hypothetical protein
MCLGNRMQRDRLDRHRRLGRRKYTATSFVQMLRQSAEPLSNRIMINHYRNIRQPQPSGNPSQSEISKPIQLFPDEPLDEQITLEPCRSSISALWYSETETSNAARATMMLPARARTS